MKYVIAAACITLVLSLSLTGAFADGSVDKGKSLFNDPSLGGSTNTYSCNTCHASGSGIEGAGSKKYSSFMGKGADSLEDVINICIERPLAGKALDKSSQDMKDLVSYIKSLGKK